MSPPKHKATLTVQIEVQLVEGEPASSGDLETAVRDNIEALPIKVGATAKYRVHHVSGALHYFDTRED